MTEAPLKDKTSVDRRRTSFLAPLGISLVFVVQAGTATLGRLHGSRPLRVRIGPPTE